MISYIKSNYENIITLAFLLVSFVCNFATLRKARKSETLVRIVSSIPEIISQVESVLPNGFGDVKLGFVLRQIEKLCIASRVPFDKLYMTEQVEKVLSAPTKNISDKEV